MKIPYTPTFIDYKAALNLHRRQGPLRVVSFYFWYVAIPILASLGIVIIILGELGKQRISGPLLWGSDGALLWLAIYLPAWRSYSMRKCFRQIFSPEGVKRSISIEIDDSQIVSIIPGISEGKYFWATILAFAKDEKVTLLYIRKNAFLFIPNAAMSLAQRTELDDLVARNLVRKS